MPRTRLASFSVGGSPQADPGNNLVLGRLTYAGHLDSFAAPRTPALEDWLDTGTPDKLPNAGRFSMGGRFAHACPEEMA